MWVRREVPVGRTHLVGTTVGSSELVQIQAKQGQRYLGGGVNHRILNQVLYSRDKQVLQLKPYNCLGIGMDLLSCYVLVVLLVSGPSAVRSDFTINLTSTLDPGMVYKNFSSYYYQYQSSESAYGENIGFLRHLNSAKVCEDELPIVPKSSVNWFVVFKSYPACFQVAVDKVKEAGYKLIVVGDTATKSDIPDVGGYDFPIVATDPTYADYLSHNATSNFTSPSIEVTVYVYNSFFVTFRIILSVIVTLVVIVFMCVVTVGIVACKNWARSLRPGGSRHNSSNYNELTASTLSVNLPLDQERIHQLPSTRYLKKGVSIEYCSICCEELKTGEMVRDLPCGHNSFHKHCLDDWLGKGKRSCPLCRHNVTKKVRKSSKAHVNHEGARVERVSSSNLVPANMERNYQAISASMSMV